jgi:hypothetical protein
MSVFKLLQTAVCLAVSCFIFSCEGLKFISVENKSKTNITITTHPEITTPELTEYPKTYRNRVDTIITLPPDSSLLIPVYFGPLYIFNEKIKQEEIKFDYLKIISETDTILANNKTELFKLLKRKGNIGRITVR